MWQRFIEFFKTEFIKNYWKSSKPSTFWVTFGSYLAHLCLIWASFWPIIASIWPIQANTGPLQAIQANTGHYRQYRPIPAYPPTHYPMPHTHAPCTTLLPHHPGYHYPPHGSTGRHRHGPQHGSRRLRGVHQASFGLNTKTYMEYWDMAMAGTCKTGNFRYGFCLDFAKSAVFGLILLFLALICCFWPIMA